MSKINMPFATLSLVTSIFLWASVYNFQNRKPEQTTVDAILTTKNLDSSRYLITQIPSSVPLTMAGFPDDLRKISRQNVSTIVDLSNPTVGDNKYPVIVFSSTARELLVNGITVHIKIEALVTKRIEVSLVKTGILPAGFHEESVDTYPRWIYVTGPSETVQKVSTVQTTVDLATLNRSPYDVESDAKAVDLNGRPLSKLVLKETEEPKEYSEEASNIPVKIRISFKLAPDVVSVTPPPKKS